MTKQTYKLTKAAAVDEFVEGQRLLAVADFEPEAEGDLQIVRREVLEFLEYEDDPAWLEVKNGRGQTGFVPRAKVVAYQSDMELSEGEGEGESGGEGLKSGGRSKWQEARGLLEKGALKIAHKQSREI